MLASAPAQCGAAPRAPRRSRAARGARASAAPQRAGAAASPAAPPVAPQTHETQRTPAWVARHAQNAALAGNFAPVEKELTLNGLRVDGRLPASVDGAWLRNGPNPRFEPVGGYHWFDGAGMVHAVRLRGASDGGAEYSNRYVRTHGFSADSAAGKRVHLSLTEPPQAGPILRGMGSKGVHWAKVDAPYWVIQTPNNANNGIKYHAGRLLATYEAGSAYEMELGRELRTRGVCDFNGTWSSGDHWRETFTAHSKLCPRTGELVYMGYCLVPFNGPPTVTVGVVGPGGGVTHRATLPVARPAMQHDMGITATRTVLIDGPLVFNLAKAAAGGAPFDFLRGEPLRFGVLPRRGTAKDVVWIDAECCFAYHVVNCWDDPADPDRVVVVLCRMRETRALGMADPVQRNSDGALGVTHETHPSGADVPFAETAHLHRFVLDLRSRRVVESAPLAGLPSDFPVVHPAAVGAPCRFAFAAGVATDGAHPITIFDSLLKHDLSSGDVIRRPLPPGVLCGDVAFAPRVAPGGAAAAVAHAPAEDDDGHILLMTHVLAEERAELLVLDARDILAPPVATVHIPVRVPFGFHCEWVPGPIEGW